MWTGGCICFKEILWVKKIVTMNEVNLGSTWWIGQPELKRATCSVCCTWMKISMTISSMMPSSCCWSEGSRVTSFLFVLPLLLVIVDLKCFPPSPSSSFEDIVWWNWWSLIEDGVYIVIGGSFNHHENLGCNAEVESSPYFILPRPMVLLPFVVF